MQRWIILGFVAAVVSLCGAYFGLHAYKQSRPRPIWVPIPINASLTREQRNEAADKLKEFVMEEQRLASIVSDLKLAHAWSLPSDEAAVGELTKRIFVRTGSAQTPMGDVPAIHVGFNGTKKEIPMTEKIVMRIMDDVKIAIGLPDAEKQE